MSQTCFISNVGGEKCPGPVDEASYSNQTTLSGLMEIPLNKPDKEEIYDTSHEIDVEKLVSISVSRPRGKKVLITGTFTPSISYISKTEQQTVHNFHQDLPFQILIKKDDGTHLDPDFDLNQFVAYICVEFQNYQQVDERTITYEIVLLFWLQKINS